VRVVLTVEQRRQVREVLDVNPDTLQTVMGAYNDLLHGDVASYGETISSLRLAQRYDEAAFGNRDELQLCMALCIGEIARRWGLPYEIARLRLTHVVEGLADPPSHLLDA
jgi:hypothetical protein